MLNIFTILFIGLLMHVIKSSVLNKYYLYLLSIGIYCINFWWIVKRKEPIDQDNNRDRIIKMAIGYVTGTIVSFLIAFIFYLNSD